MKYTRVGKQILCDGEHFADAADETAAQIIVDGMAMILQLAQPRTLFDAGFQAGIAYQANDRACHNYEYAPDDDEAWQRYTFAQTQDWVTWDGSSDGPPDDWDGQQVRMACGEFWPDRTTPIVWSYVNLQRYRHVTKYGRKPK